jgi:hypothetical protein
MNLFGTFLLIIFLASAISSFYFWLSGQRVLFRYVSWTEAFDLWKIREKVPEDEWRLFKKYQKYSLFCFFGGMVLSICLFALQAAFQLFGNLK